MKSSLTNNDARILLRAQISSYNETHVRTGPRTQPQLLAQSALMKRFHLRNYADRFEDEARLLKEKKLKHAEDVTDPLENTPKTLVGLST